MRYSRLIRSVTFALAFAGALAGRALADDPGKIDIYVTPYYSSSGPVIRVGKYSSGLASHDDRQFVDTIRAMKKQWAQLGFPELYAAAIRLYDLGYRNEAIYWFYTAQYRGRLFALLVDPKKLGGIGDPAFELEHAQNAFFQLVGPDINGYAFGGISDLVQVLRKVQGENRTVPDLSSMYPGVAFVDKAQWGRINAGLNAGLGNLAISLINERASIEQQRAQNGTQARFAHVTSKPFPGMN